MGNFPTIFQQTGHTRTGPYVIIQDPVTLNQVKIFNFPWDNEQYKEYCRSRGIVFPKDKNQLEYLENLGWPHTAKFQDLWELYLRGIGELPEEKYGVKTIKRNCIHPSIFEGVY